MTDEQYLLYAVNAALLAGQEVERIYHAGFEVEIKADDSPVTEADLASDRIIREALQATGLEIISEEVEQLPFEQRKTLDRYWCVDPIDGTIGFVNKNGNFCICIAQIFQERAHIGVIYLPTEGLLYYGLQGFGAFKAYVKTPVASLGELDAQAMPSQIHPDVYTVVASQNHLNEATMRYIDSLRKLYGELDLKRIGSAIKFCQLADGLAHHYPRFGRMNDWDLAAGHAILQAAGGRIETHQGEPLLYNGKELFREDFMCWLD